MTAALLATNHTQFAETLLAEAIANFVSLVELPFYQIVPGNAAIF